MKDNMNNASNAMSKSRLSLNVEDKDAEKSDVFLKIIIYIACIILAILSIMPFWIMIVNATRSTIEITRKNWKTLANIYIYIEYNV